MNFSYLQNFNGSLQDLLASLNISSSDFKIHDDFPASEKAFKISMYAIAMLLAMCGNVLLIFVILRTKSLRTKFNFFVLNLAFVDLLVPGFCMWLHLIQHLNESYWTLGPILCRIKTFVQVFTVTVSSYTLTITVVDRHMSAFYPNLLKITQGYQISLIISVWIIGAMISLPWLLYTKLVTLDLLGGQLSVCQAHFPSLLVRKAYITFYCVVGYCIPVIVMFILVVRTMTRPTRTREPALPTLQITDDMKRAALRLLLTILIVFFLCWTPQQSLLIWDVYRPRDTKTKLPAGIRSYVYWAYYVAYSSTCLYPIIYMSFNKSFRHALKNLISPRRQDADLTTISPGPSNQGLDSTTEREQIEMRAQNTHSSTSS